MGNAITPIGASDQLATIERQLNADVARARELIHARGDAIPRALERVADLDVPALTAAIVMLRQPAADDELQTQLAILVGSFPTAPKTNLEIFGRARGSMLLCASSPQRCGMLTGSTTARTVIRCSCGRATRAR
jgi:hypothetical protein